MRFALKVDGSIEGELPAIRLTHYDVTETGATPKYLCKHREGLCGMSPCGKRPVFRWFCLHFSKRVSLTDCEGCNAREQGS